jgi:hypothetical protein
MLTVFTVVVGIIFVFLLVSLVVSAANEVVQALISGRRQYLKKGLSALLQNATFQELKQSATGENQPAKPGTRSIVDMVLAHPLVSSLKTAKTGAPSYMPSDLFVAAFLDLINQGMLSNGAGGENLGTLIAKIDNEPLRTALTTLWEKAGGEIESFKKELADWFDDVMDRVSGWYKIYAQYWLLGLSFFVSVACNVDSIHLLKQLSSDPAVRAATYDQATKFLQTSGGSAEGSAEIGKEASDRLKTDLNALQDLPLPVGWDQSQTRYIQGHWLTTILGWLITTLAASLGAPFWFDTLTRIMNIRAAGVVPPKASSTKDSDGN